MKRELYKNNIDNYQPQKLKTFLKVECKKVTKDFCGWKKALYWNLATLGKSKIYVVYDGNKMVHCSYVIHGNEKFTFLQDKDIEIGPCWTHPDYRGNGIYPAILSLIIEKELSNGGDAYMIVSDENIASQKGVLKVGFKKTGNNVVKGILKRHYIK